MKNWQQDLVNLHPEVFVRRFRGIAASPGYPVCHDGWCDIVSKLVERVSAAAAGYPIYFVQILEGRGCLKVYWKADASIPTSVERMINEAIELAEARSACTCAICGAKGQLFSSGNRLLTACPDHSRGNSVPVPSALQDVHIVRAFIRDNLSVACRRYDWLQDKFVEIYPAHVDNWRNNSTLLGRARKIRHLT
ncbi:hypothetical protein [Bradyrhizobium sp. CER78]|uniref:hypothetical protein n=1 Tax=Bradyrhizobium sp. CER78 TaxID=3039162 RepID=UPI002449714A|nr:hypothetical protein [Bradyrhizobium sp. CER78]MDH2386402.1 hypothetical protein [Bradyrhizobium sp. CER78]